MGVFETPKGRHVWPQRTICEVHRETYDLCVVALQDRPDQLAEIKSRLEEAFVMGVKLCDRLIEHKLTDFDWQDQNTEEAAKLRNERIRLEKILNEPGCRIRPERQ